MAVLRNVRRRILLTAAICAVSCHELAAAPKTLFPEGDGAKSEKRAIVENALFLVSGIALLGVFLIVMVVLWAIRLRRRNRKEKPAAPPFDPLWYLKSGGRKDGQAPPPKDSGTSPDGAP